MNDDNQQGNQHAGPDAHLNAVLDTVIDGILTIDSKGVIQSANRATTRIFGYTASELIGQNIKVLMPSPYTGEHDGYLHNYLTTGSRKVIGIGREVTGKRKDGSTLPMELGVSEMEIAGDRMFTGIVRDITERKQAELELQARENRIRALIDTIVDGIVVIDAKGRIQTLNPAAVKLFGYQEDEVTGQNINMLMPEPYAKEHDGYLHNYLTTGVKKVIGIGREVTGKRKDGSTFPMELAVSEMDVNGERMFTGIVRDITERKNIERMKSEFISTVSHELRTPLTSIRGALGLVLGKAAGQLPEKARRMLEMAERNSERLTMLINDILDLEKIEAGRLEFEFKIVDLGTLAQRALDENEGYAKKHSVQLTLNKQPTPSHVWADENRLLQVFANLISNAVKYSPENGEVTVTITEQGKDFRLSVRDRGAGIPEAFRGRIFQRFAQADSSDTRAKGGTGLGLSITKAIVERHDGRVGFHSQSGDGTTFHVDLPARHADSGTPNAETAATDPTRVLICEDNPDAAQILAEIIATEGIISDIAGSAAGARTLLSRHNYRLMLLDLSLPDVDGLSFLQELRSDPGSDQMPIIVVSASAGEGSTRFTGDALTVVDWINKPIEKDRLERALHEALRHAKRPRILHVEDDPDIVQVTRALIDNLADLTNVDSLQGARQQLGAHRFDLVILDLGLADGSGVELLDEIKSCCPIVIFSAQNPGRAITERVAAALTKSMTSNEQLLATIKKSLNWKEPRQWLN